MQPGETISPGNEPSKAQEDDKREISRPAIQTSDTNPTLQTEASNDSPVQPITAEQPAATPWQFNDSAGGSDSSAQLTSAARVPVHGVTWTASEYVAHQKNAGWFILVFLGIIVLTAAVYLLTREVVSAVVIGIVGVAFVVFGARQPRVLTYEVDDVGVRIGQRLYPYQLFRSFSVLEEDAVRSIMLMPVQRFGLPITIYYDPKDESKIIDVLGSALPHEERQVAAIDRLMSRIRF